MNVFTDPNKPHENEPSSEKNGGECEPIKIVVERFPFPKKEKTWKQWQVILPLVFSAVSLLISVLNMWGQDIGTVAPLKPTGYSIIRGIDTADAVIIDGKTNYVGAIEFPSDHIVFPMEWQNDKRRAVSIRNVELTFTRVNKDGSEYDTSAENIYKFSLAGTYPEISSKAFTNLYNVTNSFIIEPGCYTNKVLIFHMSFWYDESRPEYTFAFPENAFYKVEISYNGQPKDTLLTALQISSEIYQDSKDYNSEPLNFWYLNPNGHFLE